MVVTLGRQYNVGENPTVILYSYINRHESHQTYNKPEDIVVHTSSYEGSNNTINSAVEPVAARFT